MSLLAGYAIGNILFILYLEANPSIQNVWYRENSQNKREIHLCNVLEYYIGPFRDPIFWYYYFWDLNPYIFSTTVALTYTFVSRFLF